MIRKNIKSFFVICALLGISLAQLGAATIDNWSNGKTITSARSVRSSADTDVLSWDGTITVSGDVIIEARRFDLTVNVTTDATILQPYNLNKRQTQDYTNAEYGQLIFYAAADHTITVSCGYDLTFSGSQGYGDFKDVEMVVTFSGQGTTKFLLNDYNPDYSTLGASLSFTGTAYSGARGTTLHRAGTKAYIIMDQTEAQAITNGQNKVVIQRNGYHGTWDSTAEDYLYQKRANHILIGPGSFITYLSTNATGLAANDTSTVGGYGSLAIDPTHAGTGRMVLRIAGDDNSFYNFNDGGLIIAGHYVTGLTAANFRNNVYLNAIAGQKALFRIIDSVDYSHNPSATYDPDDADARGLLVINENTTVPKLAADPYGDIGDYDFLASDYNYSLYGLQTPNSLSYGNYHDGAYYYWAYDYAWFRARNNAWQRTGQNDLNVQTGFVMGVNGWMDVYHKTFLDYVAANINRTDRFAVEDIYDYTLGADWTYAARTTDQYIKERNPASFVVDGLNFYSNYNAYFDDGTYYQVTNPADASFDRTRHAHIVFYGDAKMYAHCSRNADGTTFGTSSVNNNYGPFFDTNGELVYTFTVGSGTYNGEYVTSTNLTSTINAGEGANVIDIQGQLSVWSKARNDAPARSAYVAGASTEQGEINLPTVQIDYLGREYTGGVVGSNLVTRPLTKTSVTYAVYNSPSIFMNDRMELHNVTFNHNDVLKKFPFITTGEDLAIDPYYASPSIVGGERKFVTRLVWSDYGSDTRFSEFTEWPRIWLYNSELDLHESICSSGVRWLVQDIVYTITAGQPTVSDASNTSVIKYYDHGKDLDALIKGYGRLFMLGSAYNRMSDVDSNGRYTNVDVESAFLNVYRNNKTALGSTVDLSLQQAYDSGVSTDVYSPHATHLMLMSRLDYVLADPATQYNFGKAYLSLGWTTTVGDSTSTPWNGIQTTTNYFSLDATTLNNQATLSVDGDYVYFGGTNANGTKCRVPVSSATQGGVIYVNHGGRITVGQPLSGGSADWTKSGYEAFFDTMIASRLWSTEGLSGTVDIPKDQAVFGNTFGAQVYDVNTSRIASSANLRLNVYNSATASSPRKAADKKAGEEVTVAWNKRTDGSGFIPVRTFGLHREPQTRWTKMPSAPVDMPNNLLYITTNDLIDQLKVAGSTQADPFYFYVTSEGTDTHGFGQVREFVSVASNPVVPGEGDIAALFVDKGGRIGLGSRETNKDSKTAAWTRLGEDFVTIYANGIGTVDVNSNLVVHDRKAVLPTTNFGQELLGPNADENPRITFFSSDSYEIRVPKGVEFDLSAFNDFNVRQEIAFGGKLRLVFEPGSTLRFPSITTDHKITSTLFPTLYMNDESELVFEADQEFAKEQYSNITDADANKIKIKGSGQIWLNKNAKMLIMDNSQVAVQSDEDTPLTDITISMQRQSEFWIGDTNTAGGSFEVGNPTELSTTTHKVNFNFIINGGAAGFHIDREGFFGLGVGVINKYGNVNGGATEVNALGVHVNPSVQTDGTYRWLPADGVRPSSFDDATPAWHVKALYNVHRVSIDVQEGIFDHSNIYDGTDVNASLIAIGPVTDYQNESGYYNFEVTNPKTSVILGGGNLMYVEAGKEPYVNIWAYSDYSDTTTDVRVRKNSNGTSTGDAYGIMASAPIILQATTATTGVSNIDGGGRKITVANPAQLFNFIRYPEYSTLGAKFVNIGQTAFENHMDYVLTASWNGITRGGDIYRSANIPTIGTSSLNDALAQGILGATGTNSPASFVPPLPR
ncbi:hypothetical protein K9L16_04020 [Candidatus Pacearchaeota archaeon]|nr:hypothetical protein [Candidatus Pacearchaeota archaeon]